MNSETHHRYWTVRISKRWVKRVVITMLIASLVIFLSIPMYCDYTDRARISMIINKIEYDLSIEIKEIATINNQLNKIVNQYNNSKYLAKDGNQIVIEHYEIDANGKMYLITSGLPVYIEMYPMRGKNRQIIWGCYGRPKKLMPAYCRDEKRP